MPGMNDGLNINDPTVVAAFKAALLHQGIWALVIFAVLGVAWVAAREWLPGIWVNNWEIQLVDDIKRLVDIAANVWLGRRGQDATRTRICLSPHGRL